MIETDSTGQLYGSIVESSIDKIAKEGLSLKPFLSSKLAYLKVDIEDGIYHE